MVYLEKFFWKYFLQLYVVHRFFCLPNILFDELCILFYGGDIYHTNKNKMDKFFVSDITSIILDGNQYDLLTDSRSDKRLISEYWKIYPMSNVNGKLYLPFNLRILPEDFDLLLYDEHHLSIMVTNAPSDYTSKISSDVVE